MAQTIELKVEGMTCQGCVRSVEKKLAGISGVQSAKVDLEAGRALVEYDPARTGAAALIGAVEQLGFHAGPS